VQPVLGVPEQRQHGSHAGERTFCADQRQGAGRRARPLVNCMWCEERHEHLRPANGRRSACSAGQQRAEYHESGDECEAAQGGQISPPCGHAPLTCGRAQPVNPACVREVRMEVRALCTFAAATFFLAAATFVGFGVVLAAVVVAAVVVAVVVVAAAVVVAAVVAATAAHVGLVIVSVSSVTAPLRASTRPSTVTPVVTVMLVNAMIVPRKVEPVPRVALLKARWTMRSCRPPVPGFARRGQPRLRWSALRRPPWCTRSRGRSSPLA
jgi:hypothetical protein